MVSIAASLPCADTKVSGNTIVQSTRRHASGEILAS